MEAYFEATRQQQEAECESFLQNSCNCQDRDDDNYNEEYCEYDCYVENEMSQCVDRNPYEQEDGEEERFELEEYMECAALNIENNNRRRRLEENEEQQNQQQEEEEEVQYYVGPYCADQGGAINLALFSDDTCTELAQGVTFYELMGFELPYAETSLVSANCLSCLEPADENDQNNENADADPVSESCEMLYQRAGKCESQLPEGMVAYPNEAACNYMEGIRIVRQDGIIDTHSSRPSAVATAFIVIFAMAFCAMAFYVWYLRTRLGVKKNTLL
jgi:hypothetical protein